MHPLILVVATAILLGCGLYEERFKNAILAGETAAQDATAVEGLTAEIAPGVTMDFVWIEPGTFLMGTPGRDTNEWPQHEVTISQGFYLGKYEITQKQWEAVMGTKPWQNFNYEYLQDHPDHPAENISWEGVQVLIQRLNEVAGAGIYRLPTEAEWEYAARAGTTTRWSFGNNASELGDYAWFVKTLEDGFGSAPVGTKLPNPWGLHDMYGNVSEWVHDYYKPNYTSTAVLTRAVVDPTGPLYSLGSPVRVIRGGNWAYTGTSSTRNAWEPDPGSTPFMIGARLLRTR